MKRKYQDGGLAEATGAAIRNRIAEMVGKQAPESVMMPGIRGLYKPSGRTGPVNPMNVELNPDDSPIMTRGKQPPLPANFVEEAVPELPMEVSRSDLPMRRRRPMTPYGEPTFAKGGSVKSKGIDGCAQRGKTRGKYL